MDKKMNKKGLGPLKEDKKYDKLTLDQFIDIMKHMTELPKSERKASFIVDGILVDICEYTGETCIHDERNATEYPCQDCQNYPKPKEESENSKLPLY